MAVAQGRTTRSKRGMRRAHDFLTKPTLSTESKTGEIHLRHHVSKEGFYKGKLVRAQKTTETTPSK